MVEQQTQNERHLRQVLLAEIGEAGQQRLANSRVLVVGAGGLGSPVALYLAAAGVGTIGIVDFDAVELSNLQRQILYATADLGKGKAAVASERLRALDDQLTIDVHPLLFTRETGEAIVEGYDLVVDCVDSMAGKQAIASVCHFRRTPYVHGGVTQFAGQILTVKPGESACLRCLAPWDAASNDSQSDGTEGVIRGPLGAVVGTIGTIQATEVIKLLLDIGQPLLNRCLVYDGLLGTFREVRLKRKECCPLCGCGL